MHPSVDGELILLLVQLESAKIYTSKAAANSTQELIGLHSILRLHRVHGLKSTSRLTTMIGRAEKAHVSTIIKWSLLSWSMLAAEQPTARKWTA